MKLLFLVCFVLAISVSAAEKTIPQLINDLKVKDKGNHTCNGAVFMLVRKGDKAVPYLQKAISNPDKQTRHYAVLCLGHINTQKARKALINAFFNGPQGMRSKSAYALAWHPDKDAENIYIASLADNKNEFYTSYMLNALGKIKSTKALPKLKAIIAKPRGWRLYYSAFRAIREIEGKTPSKELNDAVIFMQRAQYMHSPPNKQRLEKSADLIRENMDSVLPDLFNSYMAAIKGNRFYRDPDVITLLDDAGRKAYPYIKIGLNDPDDNVRWKTEALLKELNISKETIEKDSFWGNLVDSIF